MSRGVDDFVIDAAALPLDVMSLRFSLGPRPEPWRMGVSVEPVPVNALIHVGFDRLNQCVNTEPRHRATRARALVVALLCDLLAVMDAASAGEDAVLSPQQVAAIHRTVDEGESAGVGPSDLAAACGLTLDYFTRLFRSHFGMPPRRWLREQRMRRAAALLTDTTLSVKEISRQLGVTNQRLLARQFRAYHGASPTEYRQRGT